MATSKQPIQTFLNSCRTKGSSYAYRSGVLRFLDFIYGPQMSGEKATKEEFARYEKLAVQYFSENRAKAADDLVGFIRHMNQTKVLPKTANIKACGVRQWLIDNDISFTEKQRQQMRKAKPRGGRRTNIKYADTQTIREIIAHGDIRLRALVLMLASSGMRIGEAIELTWSQVRIPDRTKESERDKLTSVFISDSKTGLSRTAWITREAEEALLEWKKAIPAYLNTAAKKGKNIGIDKDAEDKHIFPYRTTSVYMMWDAACKASGHYVKDEKTRRNQLNVHRLRGFFKSQTMPIIGGEYSELLLGHSDQYGNAYNGLPEGKLAEMYRKCEIVLTITAGHGISQKLADQTSKLAEQEETIEALKAQMAKMQETMRRTNLEFQNQMAKMIADLRFSQDFDVSEGEKIFNKMSNEEKEKFEKDAAKGGKIAATLLASKKRSKKK